MKQVSTKFQNKMQENLRSWVPRMTINGTEISGDIQTGLTINLGSCGAEEFNIGTVFIPSITATISDCSTVLQNKEIKLEMGLVLDDGTIEYVPVGYFTVEKPNKGKFATSFTAYGRLMSKMGGMYESTLTYPTAINNVLSEISSKTGVTIKLNGLTGTSTIPLKPTGLNYREAVQLIAGLLGGFVTENSAGEVVICKYQLNDALTVDTSFCYEYPFVHDEKYAVTGLSVKTDNAEFSYGTPNISVANGYMSEALFEVCKNNIMGFSYMPGSVHFLGDIRLDPWDSLKVTDDDEVYQIPCMDIVHVWDGGLITTINAPGTTEAEDGSGFEGSLKIIEDKISGIDGVTAAIETLFEIDKIHGTIKLQAGKLLEILSGGTFVVNAENYKLNEDGTVTINGGTIGGFVINDGNIVKYDADDPTQIVMMLKANGDPSVRVISKDGAQYGMFGWSTDGSWRPSLIFRQNSDGTNIVSEFSQTDLNFSKSSPDGSKSTSQYSKYGVILTETTANNNITSTKYGLTGITTSGTFTINGNLISYVGHDHSGETINPQKLYVTGESSLNSGVANVRMIRSGANKGQIVFLTNASSKRFKHDIHPLSEEQKARFRKLYDVEVKNWKYNEDYIGKSSNGLGKERYGLIAEDVAEFIPEAVFDDEDGNIENYDDRKILNAMLFLIQEQKRQIDSLEKRVEKLEQMLVK